MKTIIYKSTLFVVMVVLSTITAKAFNLSAKSLSGQKGTTIILPISLTNESDISAFECQMVLPEGLSVATLPNGRYDIQLSNRAAKSHVLVSNKLSNDKIKIGAYSSSNAVFTGNTGEIFYVPIHLEGNSGVYTVRFTNAAVTSPTGKETVCAVFEVTVTIASAFVVVSNTASTPDTPARFSLEFNNEEDITAFECELVLPDEIEFGQNGNSLDLSKGPRASSHTLISNKLSNGTVKVGLYSSSNKSISGNKGELFSGSIKLRGNLGTYKIQVKNIYATTPTGKEIHLDDVFFYVSFTNTGFSVEDVEIIENRQAPFYISLNNEEAITAFSCSLILPDGLELVQENGEYAFEFSERADPSHTLSANKLSDGSVKILSYSTTNMEFVGNDGSIVIGNISAISQPGVYEIKLKDCYTVSSDGRKNICSDCAFNVNIWQLGDVNKDGKISITDVTVLTNYIVSLENLGNEDFLTLADINGDGKISITDVTVLISLIVNH